MADKNNITRIGGDMFFDIPPTPPFVRPRYPAEYQNNATDGKDGYDTTNRELRQNNNNPQVSSFGSGKNRSSINKGSISKSGGDFSNGQSREQNQLKNSNHGSDNYRDNNNKNYRNHNNQNHKPIVAEDIKKEPRGKFPFGGNLLRLLNFKNFNLGSDSIIIIVLILLLSKEETDEYLLMALVYIMM